MDELIKKARKNKPGKDEESKEEPLEQDKNSDKEEGSVETPEKGLKGSEKRRSAEKDKKSVLRSSEGVETEEDKGFEDVDVLKEKGDKERINILLGGESESSEGKKAPSISEKDSSDEERIEIFDQQDERPTQDKNNIGSSKETKNFGSQDKEAEQANSSGSHLKKALSRGKRETSTERFKKLKQKAKNEFLEKEKEKSRREDEAKVEKESDNDDEGFSSLKEKYDSYKDGNILH